MRIELISIGDEVLKGMIVNTNVSFLGRELTRRGWDVAQQTTLPDQKEALLQGIRDALERASCVICTGGLGPTCDDVTKEVAAALVHSPMHFDQTVAADLKKRYGNQLASLEHQATVPEKAKVLMNQYGTAPGFIFSHEGKTLVLLPGVPSEMSPMFLNQVIPFLKKESPPAAPRAEKTIHLCLLSETKVDPVLRQMKSIYPDLGTGIYPGYGTLTVVLSHPRTAVVEEAEEAVRQVFPNELFSSPSGKIEEALQLLMIKKHKTVALAESMTGGKMAAQLTALQGASDFFLGSFVVYSNAFKQRLLGVKEMTLKNHGAVSREVVAEMLEGIFLMSDADYGIAVSGIAGPSGGSEEKPVGTVWAAMGERGKNADIVSWKYHGQREANIFLASTRLFAGLWRKVSHGVPFSI